MILCEWVSLLLKLSLYQLYHQYIFICFFILLSHQNLLNPTRRTSKTSVSLGREWVRDQLWHRFGGARAFVFNLVCPQTIPQLSTRLPSTKLPLFSKVDYVIARSTAKNFRNDVCKCTTIGRATFLGNLHKSPVKLWPELCRTLAMFTKNYWDFKWWPVTV